MAEIYNPQDDPVEDRAAFAQRFRGTTNLDQRRRFAQDISEAKARAEEREQAMFEEQQLKDPRLMQAVTGRLRERRLANEGFGKADLAERKFSWDQEKAVRSQALQERSLNLRQMQEQRLFNKAERDLADAEKIEADTLGVEEAEYALRDRGIMPGSATYRDSVLNILARSPYVDPNYRRALVESAKINLDADELQAQLADLQEKFPGASFTIGPDGRPTIRQSPTKPAPEPKIDLGRLDKLTKEEAELSYVEKPTQAQIKRLGYLQNEIKAIDEQRKAAATPASPTAQATPAQPKAITVDDARALLKEVGGDKEKARALARERGYQW